VYLKLWNNVLAITEAVMASLIAMYLYVQLRKLFNHLDTSGYLPIKKKEIQFFATLISFTMLFSIGKVPLGRFPTGILWMHIGNVVVLSFLAFTDFKTKLLDVPVLGYLFAQNLFIYIISCFSGGTCKQGDLMLLCVYVVTIIFCCLVKAIAVGDGCIYFAMLPVMLILQGEADSSFVLLFLLSPLILFLLVESTKAICKKSLSTLVLEREAFAPYLLVGYIASYLLYVKSCLQ